MALLFLLMSAFLFGKSSTFTQSNTVRVVLEIFSFISNFCKIKGYYLRKCKFYRLNVQNPASGLLQIGLKLEKWQWRHTSKITITIEFYIRINLGSKFQLQEANLIFETNFKEKDTSSRKQKKQTLITSEFFVFEFI